ncbi:MAG: tRNA-dihydrouridine synthase [bacterium]|nr:tRNA-dihydrouridine synthase [bacterium]
MKSLHKCFDDNLPILAPLAGITGRAFRETCREYGCHLSLAPMISANGLKYPSSRSKTYALFDWQDEPNAWVQLFGSDIEAIRDGVKILSDSGACAIDINLGCSMAKVLKQGAGAALLKKPALALQILEAAASASPVPVTAKMRLGYDNSDACAQIAAQAHNAGICALAIHARTAVMGFSGACRYEAVRPAALAAKIPVIVNGDITNAATAAEAMEKSGCHAFMIGRPAIGFPQIFTRFANATANAPSWPPVRFAPGQSTPMLASLAPEHDGPAPSAQGKAEPKSIRPASASPAPEQTESIPARPAPEHDGPAPSAQGKAEPKSIRPASARPAPERTESIPAPSAPGQSFTPTPAEVAEGFLKLAQYTELYSRDEEQSVRELRRIFAMSAHYLPASIQKSPAWNHLFQCLTFTKLTKNLSELVDFFR